MIELNRVIAATIGRHSLKRLTALAALLEISMVSNLLAWGMSYTRVMVSPPRNMDPKATRIDCVTCKVTQKAVKMDISRMS